MARSGSPSRAKPLLLTWLSAAIALVMISQQIASKAVRDGFFLGQFEITSLPTAAIAAALASFAAALILGRFIAAFSPGTAVPVLFGLNGILFFGGAALSDHFPRAVAAGLYLQTAVFGGAVVSGFWSVINESFDPYAARQAMGRIAGGATLGGVVGGALTWRFADASVVALLAALGASNWLCGAALLRVARRSKRRAETKVSVGVFDGFSVLSDNAYPRRIALLVFLGALMTAIIDYVFKADIRGARGGSLVGFFAIFYTCTGIVTFLVQSLLSTQVLKRFGVVPAVAMFPLVALGGLAISLVVPSLLTVVALRGGAMVLENSLYRSGYELLYTPVPPAQKRVAKMLIDVGCDRIGAAAGGGVALVAIAIAVSAAQANKLLLSAGFVTATALIVVLFVLRRQYVGSLASQIRRSQEGAAAWTASAQARTLAATFVEAAVDLDWEPDGAGERRSASHGERSTSGLSRAELELLVKARAAAKSAPHAATSAVAAPLAPKALPGSEQPGLPALSSLVSERLLATPVEELLRASSTTPAWDELVRSVPAIIGQLSDILLSVRHEIDVRLRAAQLLSMVPNHRSVAALAEALDAREFRLRRVAALGLLRICATSPSLAPSRRTLTRRASRELRSPVRPHHEENELERSSPFRTDAVGRRLAPSIELALVLLAIGGDVPALRLAINAVTSDDPVQRGTGLEYLDNLLPNDVRFDLLALAKSRERIRARQSLSREKMAELAARLRSGQLGLRQLRLDYQSALQHAYEAADAAREVEEARD